MHTKRSLGEAAGASAERDVMDRALGRVRDKLSHTHLPDMLIGLEAQRLEVRVPPDSAEVESRDCGTALSHVELTFWQMRRKMGCYFILLPSAT